MKMIDIKGTIVSDDDKWIYDCFRMDSVSPKEVKDALDAADGEDVTFNINSGGGDVAAGNEIYYLISQYSGTTIADISGFACSAASYLALAADKVRMVPSGAFMIHNVQSETRGDYHDMDKASASLKAVGEGIAHAYSIKTGKPMEDILALMDNETWLNAKQALEFGFIDEIITDTVRLTNSAGNILSPQTVDKMKSVILSFENQAKNKLQTKLNYLKIKGGNKK